jgi:hypothetical protein
VELSSELRCGERGVGDSAALCNFGGASRHKLPYVLWRHPGVAPGRPHVRLSDAEGPFGHKPAPLRAILREGSQFGESKRGAVRARLANELEVTQDQITRSL